MGLRERYVRARTRGDTRSRDTNTGKKVERKKVERTGEGRGERKVRLDKRDRAPGIQSSRQTQTYWNARSRYLAYDDWRWLGAGSALARSVAAQRGARTEQSYANKRRRGEREDSRASRLNI